MVCFRYCPPKAVLLEDSYDMVVVEACCCHVNDEWLKSVYAHCRRSEHGTFYTMSATCTNHHARRFARVAVLLKVYGHIIQVILNLLRRIKLPEYFHFLFGKTEHTSICASCINKIFFPEKSKILRLASFFRAV